MHSSPVEEFSTESCETRQTKTISGPQNNDTNHQVANELIFIGAQSNKSNRVWQTAIIVLDIFFMFVFDTTSQQSNNMYDSN